MYLFAHLGLGYAAVKPWWRSVPLGALLLGTVISDLIDKPLYYGCSYFTGRQGAAIGLISGTRTFGHTAIFLILCLAVAVARRSKIGLAFAAGIATHLFLDSLQVYISSQGDNYQSQSLLFPLHGWQFPTMVYPSFSSQLGHWFDWRHLIFEIFGVVILLGIWIRSVYAAEP